MKALGDIFSSFLTPAIAIITTYIAYQQYQSNRLKLRLERYDRRLRVYQEMKKVLSIILRDADISPQQLLEFRTATAEADFLFGKNIPEYIDEIYKKGLELWRTGIQLKEGEIPKGTERRSIVEENSKLLTWLIDQLPMLTTKFKPYLNLND